MIKINGQEPGRKKRMKKFKRIMVLFLSVLMVIGAMPVTAMAGDMMDFESYDDGSAFKQKFVEVKKISTGKTGAKMTVSFVIVNPLTETDMTNVKIKLANEKQFKEIFKITDEDSVDETKPLPEYPFEYTADIGKVKDDIGTIKAGAKKTVTMSYKVKRNLKEGYYPAVFYLSYGDHNRDIPIGVNIWVSPTTGTTEADKDNKIDYDFVMGENQATPFASYTQVMDFGVNLRNSGLKKVYDVRAYIQLSADTTKFPFDINDGNYDRLMGDMEAEQVVTLPYSMAVRDDVKSGFYPISFKITYREESNGDFVTPIEKIFFVRVQGKDDEDKIAADAGENVRTKARIIVESFSTDPAEIYAGNLFTLHVKMKNASSNIAASNIMFTFASEEVNNSPVFTTDTGSTSMVVNQLAPGASVDLAIKFQPSPTAEQKSYIMTIKEKYDSPEFKNAAEDVKVSIPVKQKPRINTGTIEVMPDNISVGSETNVMFGINNTGKVLLYNVMAKFEGDSIQTSDAYVGNIKPGETGNVDTMISGIAPTMDDGKIKITISFEDENGVKTELAKEMSLTVNEEITDPAGDMEAGNMDGTNDMAQNQSFFSKYKMAIIAAAVLLAAAVGMLILKKKKQKKASEEEGMDDEIS